MRKLLLLFFTIAFACSTANAQFSKYIIRFKHKGDNPFAISNPSQYLSNRALARRTKYAIAIDSADLPVTPRFLDSIRLSGAVTILNTSKWLNQVAIQTNDAAALAKINSFPFVISSAPIAPFLNTKKVVDKKLDAPDALPAELPAPSSFVSDHYNYGQSYGQVHIHNGEFLHNRGFRGQGMQLSIMDAGFFHYLSLPTFDSIRNNGQVLGTWDFVTGNASVDEDDSHGMKCLSAIAANIPGSFVGTGPKAAFYLFRTEDANSEYPIEEQNWIAAAERADSLGVDVFSTSLGYYTFDNAAFNHIYADLDGNTTPIAKAADIAAKKGIIAVVAAGNEGQGSWHYIITPADADSVIAVGAVSTTGIVGGFSSYGPSSDGQVKPTLAAVGVSAVVANATTGAPSFANGTSYACPNLAGLVTCLWQAFPEVNNMNIISVLQQSASKFNSPDDRIGYGIPDMKKAYVRLVKQLFTKSFSAADCKTILQWNVKADSAITIDVQRKLNNGAYTTLTTLISTGAFATKGFSYTDDMNALSSGTVTYRLRMNVASDTTFFLDSLTLNFTAKPALGDDQTVNICPGGTVNLNSLYTTTGLTSNWTLNNLPVPNPAAIQTTGNYRLIAINANGCSDTAFVSITIVARPSLGPDKAITKCANASANLITQFITAGLTSTWTLNGVVVANAAAVTAAGNYRLVVTNATGCTDTAFILVTDLPFPCTTPVVEKITISPNPVSNTLFITIARTTANKIGIIINNASGQSVYILSNQQPAGEQTYTVPMSNLADGIYYVTVSINEKRAIVKKLVKQ